MEDPDLNTHNYSQQIFDKEPKHIKDSLFNKCCWENWMSTCRRLKLDPCLSLCTKIKWILNLRPENFETAIGCDRKYTAIDKHREWFPKQNSKGSTSKRRNVQMGLHQTKKLKNQP
jgi:hypothetical protein